MNAKLRALLLPILRSVKAGKAPSFRNRSAAEQAIFLLGKPASQRRKKAAAARKSSKALEHSESTASIREAVFQRAGRSCELCSYNPPTELHHLEGGSARRALQVVENCMAVCLFCHRDFHDDPNKFRAVVALWCVKHSYPAPRRFRGGEFPIPAREQEGRLPLAASASLRGKEEG